ncbi:MAG: SpoIIE family protein phosphatase [Planctomycetaceae bacterium]|nr:SpoIIE family protein phosphatase [Planctomycetaceae bacterium]
MTRAREGGGLGLVARFALSMGVGLLVVGGLAGWLLLREATSALERARESALDDAVTRTADATEWRAVGDTMTRTGRVQRQPIEVRTESGWERARMLQARPRNAPETAPTTRLVVGEADPNAADRFLQLLVAVMIALVLVAVLLVAWLASHATSPLRELVLQVRQISLGDLRYRSRVRTGGEVGTLARALDRLATDLAEAEGTRLELSLRQRELTVANEVREALIPLATPLLPGYDMGALHLASAELGGGFHDWIEFEGGVVGLLVCDVSGNGLPAALVGATARAYLRGELLRAADPAAAFVRVNRELARDVRRGMFATALYAHIWPSDGRVQVVCAGHRIPLLYWSETEAKLRLVQPEGVALGLDRGAVFERTLKVTQFQLSPGDRLVLAGSGPIEAVDPRGEELGEKRFYQAVGRAARLDTPRFLKSVRAELEAHQQGAPLASDVSVVTLQREL